MPDAAPYSEAIARVYDLLVEGREDAEADGPELRFLLRALKEACGGDVRDVLDVGCGTGRHVIPLARSGYRVTGVDHSPAMLAECRRKLERRGLRADLWVADAAALAFEEQFDAAVCMNSVLCYLADSDRITQALRGLLRALRPGGLLVLDNCNFLSQWYTFGRSYHQERAGRCTHVEFTERRWYDDFTSLFHIELTATVEAQDGSYELANCDTLRAMTVGEFTLRLRDAGFGHVTAYPSFDASLRSEPCGDRLILLAARPEGERTGGQASGVAPLREEGSDGT